MANMAHYQNTRKKLGNSPNMAQWYDYYDYDYSYPQQYQARAGTSAKLNNQRLAMWGQGTSNNQGTSGLSSRQYNAGYPNTGGYQSNSYGQYSNGYGQNNYDYGYSSGLGAEAKQSYGSYSQSYGKECPGIPIALLLVSLLGVLVMGYILYTKIVGAGRRRRDISDSWATLYTELENFDIVILHGLEEFEEKIDKIAEGQDGGEDNWISKIYNQFSFFNEVDDTLTDADMDGLEPPLLDETWGLGVRNASVKNITANTTIEEPVKLNTEESSRKKRSIDDDEDVSENDDEEEELVDTEEKCRVDMWRCLSKVIEGGLHYIDDPDGLMGLAKKTMFKIAFHGGFSNVWSGVMTIPEARHIKQCMNDHSECVSYEILRREAEETLDPSDPAYEMYRKKPTKVAKEKKDDKEEKKPKRERLIINPEFVESLDQGDGSVQYDEDYTIDNNEV